MTKEFDLTTGGQNTYSGTMPEPGSAEVQPVVSTPKIEAPKPIAEVQPAIEIKNLVKNNPIEEKKRLIRELFDKINIARVARGEKISADELQTQRIMIENGIAPVAGGADVDPAEIIRIISEGGGR